MKILPVIRLLLGIILLVLLPGTAAAQTIPTPSADAIWHDTPASDIALTAGGRWFVPQQYRSLSITPLVLLASLDKAPLENSLEAQTNPQELNLPLPDGTLQRFYIYNSPIMEPELAAKFPDYQTYIAIGIDDPSAYGRLDWTMFGFHAMILSPNGQFFIDPFQRGDVGHYISYYKKDYHPTDKTFVFNEPLVVDPAQREVLPQGSPTVQATSGSQLRTYRLANAATGEYTAYFGGTVAGGMAAIVTSINRVTGIYEREVGVRMVLVANNDLIVYTDGTKDPYTNNDGGTMLGQNQTNLDAVILNANYDIGHVFSTGGGGVAYLQVPCESGWKAQGVTGSSAPVGDAYDVDYVAHEMGHQFGANHTFNSTTSNCGGGNRNASTAYEPGSGSTIMSYAGICGADDLQPHSDDYFHGVSFDEIITYTVSGYGNTCPVTTATGNHAPVVNAGTGGFTIPEQTPFTLTGSATDSDGDTLTYNWEEFDKGTAGPPTNPTGTAPWFRSWPSSSGPSRTFPRLSDLVNNTTVKGEIFPNITSNLTRTFRLTARDNKFSPSAGGVANANISFTVTSSAGPFLVTQPNAATVTWTANTSATVTWNVANTNIAPVNCATASIGLSVDGGYTYPYTMTAATANDGSQTITVPNVATNTSQARVRVACATSIFFDISNANFTILASTNAAPVSQNGSTTTAEDSATSINLVATDANSNPLTYTIVTPPAHGVLSGTAPALTYTPALNYNGPDSLVFKANDGLVDSNLATITITVTAVNDAPTASTIANVDWTVSLAQNYAIPAFSDVDGDTLSYSALLSGGGSLPAWLNINSTSGAFSGTPADTGTYSIVVTGNDGHGGTATASFTLTVTQKVFLPAILN
ncbi:MAG TPA: zinc-dependent metalloprotease family protein [Anaerolineaceae bacterium]|nr:zinc-dependent metalloprotease family protein [Anaerolineaceae bacterium]